VLVSLLAGCNGWGRHSGNDQREPTAAPKPIAVEPILKRVERLRGLRFRHPLKITFATPSEASSLIRAADKQEYSRRDRLIDEEELKLVGLLAPSVDLERVLRTIEEDEVLGFYDTRTKRLVVIRTKTDSRALQELTLAHELTHALEDQRFGIREPEGFNDDRAAATQALFEGTATALMTDYAERYMDLGDIASILDDIAGTDVKLPAAVERQLLFPYEQGQQFVDAFRERGNWRAIDQVIRLRHPRTTEEILHPERYAVDERPTDVDVSDLGRRLGGGWRRLDTTSIGEFDLDSLFSLVGKAPGSRAAAGWDGGRFELWRRGPVGSRCKAPCTKADAAFLRVAWDTARDRREAEKAFTHVFERGLKGHPVTGDGSRVWSSRGGAIGMVGEGLRTTVVFAPSRPVAAGLLRYSRERSGR
jgi:hypothetical protein